jgi:uncharacterized delta-60 repeat protein
MSASLVIIDSRVRDYQLLLAGLDPDTEVLILDETQDGVMQIAVYLEGRTDIDALHILSHGSEGTLYLGSTVLTSANLESYSTEWANIGSSLTETGDILLYGCNVAAGEEGIQFITSLAQYTGADVAASTDFTGSPAFSGNWQLEANNGAIDVNPIEALDFTDLLAANTAPSYSVGDGKSSIDIGGSDYSFSSVLQADGKIVVLGNSGGDFTLARYSSDGSLDTTFDSDGLVATDFGGIDYGRGIALQTDGKIVAAGFINIGSGYDFALSRYHSNGTLDATFSFDGTVTTDIFAGREDYAFSVALQADGKILVAGKSYNGVSYDFALVRYKADGTVDSNFAIAEGYNGKITTNISGDDGAFSIAVQSDGKIVVAGYSNGNFAVVRYNSNGSLDTSFDIDGKLTTDLGGNDTGLSVALQPDGKILVAGVSNGNFAVVRYNSNGSLDTSFDGDGKLTTDLGGTDQGNSVELQSDGKIIVAGSSGSSFGVVRYNSNGSLGTR